MIERWLRHQGVKCCTQWIGFSIDEIRRVPTKDHRNWCKLAFPLIDRMINRAMCRRLIEAAGLPVPRKSRCWMCPHQDEAEWQEIYDDPEQWQAACNVEDAINESDPQKSGLYLHYSRTPLRMVDLSTGIRTPTAPCEGGICWT